MNVVDEGVGPSRNTSLARLEALCSVVKQLGWWGIVEGPRVFDLLVFISGVEEILFVVDLLVPYFLDVIINVRVSMPSWPINWELHVKSHSSFSTVLSRQIGQSLIKWGSLPGAGVSLSSIDA